MAVEPGAKIRAALALACRGRRSLGSVATMRFKSISRMRLPSGAMVVPGKSFTRRRYSPRFLITISSLPTTSSTTSPIFRFPAFATTMRKYPLIGSRGGNPRYVSKRTTSVTTSRTLVSNFPPTSSISSARKRRISSTTANGSAKFVAPQRTNKAGEIIKVKGTLSVNFVPLPLVLWMSISPLRAFRFARTTSSPTPRPANSVFTGAVEKPG